MYQGYRKECHAECEADYDNAIRLSVLNNASSVAAVIAHVVLTIFLLASLLLADFPAVDFDGEVSGFYVVAFLSGFGLEAAEIRFRFDTWIESYRPSYSKPYEKRLNLETHYKELVDGGADHGWALAFVAAAVINILFGMWIGLNILQLFFPILLGKTIYQYSRFSKLRKDKKYYTDRQDRELKDFNLENFDGGYLVPFGTIQDGYVFKNQSDAESLSEEVDCVAVGHDGAWDDQGNPIWNKFQKLDYEESGATYSWKSRSHWEEV